MLIQLLQRSDISKINKPIIVMILQKNFSNGHTQFLNHQQTMNMLWFITGDRILTSGSLRIVYREDLYLLATLSSSNAFLNSASATAKSTSLFFSFIAFSARSFAFCASTAEISFP